MMNIEEILEKYGNVLMMFDYYYKYQFTYKGVTNDNETIYATIGGDSGDIYRLDVSASTEEALSSLYPNSIRVIKNKKTIVDWNEY